MSKEFDITILAKDVKPYWYSLGQLKLRRIVLAEKKETGKGTTKADPIRIGLQQPQYSRIYEQIQSLKGVFPCEVGTIIEFDDLFYNTYIRVSLIEREIKLS